jgi:hypothetical protein
MITVHTFPVRRLRAPKVTMLSPTRSLRNNTNVWFESEVDAVTPVHIVALPDQHKHRAWCRVIASEE